MKKISLFTFMLVLMITISAILSFADDSENTSSQTEISEETTNEADEEVVTDEEDPQGSIESTETPTDADTVVSEIATTESIESVVATLEQDELKVKKLNAVMAFIKSKNGRISDAVVRKVAEAALYSNEKNQLDLSLILAVMWKESTFYPTAVSPSCYGLMQIHRNTAAGFGYRVSDIKDPYRNAELGARILKGHIRSYNDLVLGLTAYNQGVGNVNRGNYNTGYAYNVIKKQAEIQAYLNKALGTA